MKKSFKKSGLLTALLLSPLVLAGCGGGDNSKESSSVSSEISSQEVSSSISSTQERISSDWEEIPANTNENLKYFGFYHSDGFVNEPAMLEAIHDLDLANFYLLNSSSSMEVLLQRLEYTRNIGYKCTVGVPSSIWLSSETETLGIGKLKSLKEGWKDMIRDFANNIKSYLDDGTVYAFYMDEPAWNGIPEDVFVEVTKFLSEEYPNTGRMACFATMEVGIGVDARCPELNSTYFDYLTDASYDLYSDWNDETRLKHLEKLKSKLTKNQYIWGTPRSFTDNPESIGRLVDHIKGMYTEAIQEPRYRGISCFSWSNGFDGDWDYGAKSFLLEDSEYYSRTLHELYSDIGRSVIGKDLIDWSNIPSVTLVAPSEVYNIGEEVMFPIFGAVDGEGNDMDATLTLTSPSGANIDTDEGEFVPEESGHYTFTVSVGEGAAKVEKTCPISVRFPGEISRFDNPSYVSDAFGNDESFWCWPREVVTDFAHSGTGSLKVSPHATDGTWPAITFARDGNTLWDISEAEKVSMWFYNPSNTDIEGFGFIFQDEYQIKKNDVFQLLTFPAKQWTNLVADVNEIASQNPKLDLTKVMILFGNCGADYPNRTVFYIDDVELIGERVIAQKEEGVINGFETTEDMSALPVPSEDSLACWPRVSSDEQAHGGTHSLKVTPDAQNGTWPKIDLGVYNLDGAEKISIWVYFDSNNNFDTFGLILDNNNNLIKTATAVAKTWSEISVDVAEVAGQFKNPTAVHIEFGQVGGTYPDRSPFYLDSFNIVGGNPLLPPTTLDSIRETLFDGPATDVRAVVAADPTMGYTVLQDDTHAGLFPDGQNEWCGLDNGASPACSKINMINICTKEIVVDYTVESGSYFYTKMTIMPWQNVNEGTFSVALYIGEATTPAHKVEFTSMTQDVAENFEYAGYVQAGTTLHFSIKWDRTSATGSFGLNCFDLATFAASQLPLPEGFGSFNEFCFFDKSVESLRNFLVGTTEINNKLLADYLSCYYKGSKNGNVSPDGSNDWSGYDAPGKKFNIKDNGSVGCTSFQYDFEAAENGYMYVKFLFMPWQDAKYTINIRINGEIVATSGQINAKTNVALPYDTFQFVNAGDVLTYEVVCDSVTSNQISLAVNEAYFGFYGCAHAL